MNAARSATCVCLVGLCFLCPYSLGLLTACAQWRFLPHTFLPFCCLFLFLRAWGWGKATWKETGQGGELRTFQSFISVISITRRIELRKEEKEWGWIFPCYLGRERERLLSDSLQREKDWSPHFVFFHSGLFGPSPKYSQLNKWPLLDLSQNLHVRPVESKDHSHLQLPFILLLYSFYHKK